LTGQNVYIVERSFSHSTEDKAQLHFFHLYFGFAEALKHSLGEKKNANALTRLQTS
jgi:hypothetical protein